MAKFSTLEEIPKGLKTADFILRNQEPIARRLVHWLPSSNCKVLEIASGWGQHACYLSWRLAELGIHECCWQPTECPERLQDILSWYQYSDTHVLKKPLEYQVGHTFNMETLKNNSPTAPLLNTDWDGILAANFCHYVNNKTVAALFLEARELLSDDGHLFIYGPINIDGRHTSEGNQNLDLWLKQRQWDSGIKDLQELQRLARLAGMRLMANEKMPANNHWLVFKHG